MLNRRDFGRNAAATILTGAGAAAAVSPVAASAAAATQAAAASAVSINVLYPNHPGARFDHAYYRATHIPLAMKVMKADSVKLIECVATPTGAAPFAMIAHFTFASMERLQAAHTAPSIADVRADIANFTDIKPQIMVGRSA